MPVRGSSTIAFPGAQIQPHLSLILAIQNLSMKSQTRLLRLCETGTDEFCLPFILVPNGSPFFPIKAHALSSNRTTIPSFLCTFFFVRTMTACLMSPRLTLFCAATPPELPLPERVSLKPRAFWTTTIMRSPEDSQHFVIQCSGSQYQLCRAFSSVDFLYIRQRWRLNYRCNSVSSAKR